MSVYMPQYVMQFVCCTLYAAFCLAPQTLQTEGADKLKKKATSIGSSVYIAFLRKTGEPIQQRFGCHCANIAPDLRGKLEFHSFSTSVNLNIAQSLKVKTFQNIYSHFFFSGAC